MPPIATPIPVPICAPVESPALEVFAAAELVDVAKTRLPPVDSSDELPAESSDNVGVESTEDVVVASFEESDVDASEDVVVDASEAVVVAVVDEDVGAGVGVAAAEELRPTVVAARSDISKDQLSEFAPLPTAAPALGFKLNQHGVSEPDHESLMRAVLFKPATPWVCFSANNHQPSTSHDAVSTSKRSKTRQGQAGLTRNTTAGRSAECVEPGFAELRDILHLDIIVIVERCALGGK